MKKIIYVAPFVEDRYKGGITRIAEILSDVEVGSNLKNKKIQIEFFNSAIVNQSKNSEGNFSFENIKQALFLTYKLSKRVLRKDFDGIHFNSSSEFPLLKDQLISSFVSFLTSKEIYFQIHYSGLVETFSDSIFLKKVHFFLFKRVDKIILLSENFKKELVNVGIPEKKLTVLHNFHTVKNINNIDLLNNSNKLELLFIGSICERKGFSDLLKAIKGLNIDYNLNVLGDFSTDENELDFKSFVSMNKLNVNFMGYLSGIKKDSIIKNSDILILPSYGEGFPMVIPEAMAFGCAIISTNIAGIPEIVEEGVNGYLINPGEIDKLSERIEFLHKNRDILKELKENGLKLSSKFTIEIYIDKLSNIYN